MRRLMLAMAALLAGTFSLQAALAQDTKQEGAGHEMSVTGTVTEVDETAQEIVVDGKTFTLADQAGTAMMPAAGDKVTLFYEEQGDKNMVTRIGQPQ